jgi:hypothetical protein
MSSAIARQRCVGEGGKPGSSGQSREVTIRFDKVQPYVFPEVIRCNRTDEGK